MIKFFLAPLVFLSLSIQAHHDPITSFEPGTYVGHAKYFLNNGHESVYLSYGNIKAKLWDLF